MKPRQKGDASKGNGHDESEEERRLFLRRSLLLGGALFADSVLARGREDGLAHYPLWMREPGRTFSNYGQPSDHERHVIRWIAANTAVSGNGVSWSPLQDLDGMITPNSLHFERHHNGVPDIDPGAHRLLVDGLVDKPLQYSVENLMRYPRRSRICFIECGGNSNAGWNPTPIQARAGHLHGLVSCSEWTGVPVSLLLQEAGVDPRAAWVVAEGADAAGLSISLPLDKLMDDAIIALYQNGERVRPENGYPLRLVVPGWEGVANVKWLRRLQLRDKPLMSRYETAKYTDLLPSGRARQFTFLMGVKSLITWPSPGFKLTGKGIHEVRGLAWSGAGRIERVEVSVDGGSRWREARLETPVLPASLTRFRFPWRWRGTQTVLVSRATDERGKVQPERRVLVQERGTHGYYHYNAQVAWQVTADGQVQHVYP